MKKMRKKPDTLDELVQVRCNESFLAALDNWRRSQDDLPSRAEAIRRLVTTAIAKDKR